MEIAQTLILCCCLMALAYQNGRICKKYGDMLSEASDALLGSSTALCKAIDEKQVAKREKCEAELLAKQLELKLYKSEKEYDELYDRYLDMAEKYAEKRTFMVEVVEDEKNNG